jgi:hypothetical protein
MEPTNLRQHIFIVAAGVLMIAAVLAIPIIGLLVAIQAMS